MLIKNIIFDIGNVLVEWSPAKIAQQFSPNDLSTQQQLIELFQSELWRDINRGKLPLDAIIAAANLEVTTGNLLVQAVLTSLTPVAGGFALLDAARQAGYGIYCISDNVHEIVAHLKREYEFFAHFQGAAISAELGILKPHLNIYQHLLDTYQLTPSECVFLDDLAHNIAGAEAVGMHGIQFINAEKTRQALAKLGVKL